MTGNGAVVVRIAGLPYSASGASRFPRTWAAAERILAERLHLAAEGRELADLLHGAIGEPAGPAHRPALLAVRRCLFQGRRPAPSSWRPAVRGALPEALAVRIDTWLERHAACGTDTARLQTVLRAEVADRQAAILDVARDPGFRRAIRESSPTLSAELGKALEVPGRPVPRKVLIRLARYVARAATKTSPYSSFTTSGFGTWVAGGPAVRFTGVPAVGVPELNAQLLQAVEEAVATQRPVAPARCIRVNPSLVRAAGGLRFLGPRPAEPLVSTPETGLLARCLELLGDGSVTTMGQLSRTVAGLAPTAGATRAGAFVDRLVTSGLVEARLPIPDHATDRLGTLLSWLDRSELAIDPELRRAIEEVRDTVRATAPVGDFEAHRRWRGGTDRALDRLFSTLGPAAPAKADEPTRAAVRHSALHDHVLHTAAPAELSASCWRPALADLQVVRRWLAALDPAAPLRLAVARLWRERFAAGAAVPFLDLHHAVQEVRKHAPTDAAAEVRTFLGLDALMPFSETAALSRDPRIRAFDEIRRRELDRLRRTPGDDGVVRIDVAALRRTIDGWPVWLRPPDSLSCYVQARDAGDDVRLVLNVAGTGHGRGTTRLAWLLAEHGAGEPAIDRPGRSPGLVRAELSGTFGSAVNVRRPALPHEIDYPFTVSGRAGTERIPLGDLVVGHDPDTDELVLRSERLGAAVTALHVGLMADFLLPPAARLLCLLFGAAHLLHPSVPLVPANSDVLDPRGVVRQPRAEIGRVVVQRARWTVPPAAVPARAGGDSDADHLLRLAAWLRREGIPDRTFVRVPDGPGPADVAGRAAHQALRKARKPFLLDIADWFAVLAFERAVRRSPGPVTFEEVLPDAAGAYATADGTRRATEFLVEVSGDD